MTYKDHNLVYWHLFMFFPKSSDLKALLIFCKKMIGKYLVSSLFDKYAYYIQSTIRELAPIADKEEVRKFFMKTMRELLKVTQESGKAEKARSSNSMQIDDSSSESSPSLKR